MSLVSVARFSDLVEARVVATALEADGIPVLVQNAQMGQTDFLLQAALGGFAIMVPEEDAKAATAFIREHRGANPDGLAGIEVDAEEDEDGEEGWAEGRARRRRTGMRWFVVAVFLGPMAVFGLAWIASLFETY